MKRGGFWMTTVATGLMVAGLMTVGRAGLKSQGFLFLAGQMKIAAGDTDNGMKLLARAATGPELNSNSMLASEKPSVVAARPCAHPQAPAPAVQPAPAIRKVKASTVEIKAAPEPTMAMLHPSLPPVALMQAAYPANPEAYMNANQREAWKMQQTELRRAQHVREINTKRLMHEISVKYGQGTVPNPEEIRMQIQKELGNFAQ